MKQVLTKISKLRAMGPEELWQSLYKKMELHVLRVLYKRGLIKPLPNKLRSILEDGAHVGSLAQEIQGKEEHEGIEAKIHCHFIERTELVFYSFGTGQEPITMVTANIHPEWRKKTVQEAEKICDLQFTFFGDREPRFQNNIDWHLDYTTGKKWPLRFSSDIPYRGPDRIGDIKYPWELSRHQYFITLGKAYRYTGDEKYAQEFCNQISSWIEENPIYRGIHWISPLEHAIRVISWTWGFYFFKDSPSLSADFFSIFVRSLWTQLRFLEKNISRGFYENNHLVGEAAGLFIGALFLKGFKRSQKWLNLGKTILLEQIEKQTHRDGVNVEQAINYQRFSMDFFILFKILHEQNIGPLPPKADDRLEKMFEYLMYVLQPDGKAPAYGDSDNARAIKLSDVDESNYGEFISIGAVLYNRGDMKRACRGMSEEVVWLLGKDGKDTFDRITPDAPHGSSRLFSEGGYCVLRDGWEKDSNYLLFDCGPLGYGTGAHGHGDALSVQICASGKEALVDPGTYAYNQDPLYRNYFRSTRAHNTVSVDGKDQAEITDRMGWGSIPTSVVNDSYFCDTFDMISAEHNGYTRLTSPVIHERTVLFSRAPLYYLLIDRMKGIGRHDYALHFHLPPESRVTTTTPVHVELTENDHLYLHVEASSEMSLEIREGDPEPMGWYSRMYGHKVKSTSLSYLCNAKGDTFLHSAIIPGGRNSSAPARFEADSERDSTVIVVERDHTHDIWFINRYPLERMYGDIFFSGKTALIRQDLTSSRVTVYGREALRLLIGGKCYFEAKSATDGVIVDSQVKNLC